MKAVAPLRRWRRVPEFHDDEDPVSYIVRLARFQLLTLQQLFGLYLGLKLRDIPDLGNQPAVWPGISVITGHDLATFERNCWRRAPLPFVIFRGRRMGDSWISNSFRLAPGVIASDGEAPYARLSWRFPALPCDLDTGELLISRCPFCDGLYSWTSTLKLLRCSNCRRDVRRATPRFAAPEVLRMARELAAAIGLIPGPGLDLPAPFGDLDLSVKLRLLEWCASFGGLLRRDGMLPTTQNALYGLTVAQRWPQDLELAVDLLFRQSRPEPDMAVEYPLGLHGLPTQKLKRAVRIQLREILKRPEYAQRDYFVPRGKPIFFGLKRSKATETASS